jgi:hypothetical protein
MRLPLLRESGSELLARGKTDGQRDRGDIDVCDAWVGEQRDARVSPISARIYAMWQM